MNKEEMTEVIVEWLSRHSYFHDWGSNDLGGREVQLDCIIDVNDLVETIFTKVD